MPAPDPERQVQFLFNVQRLISDGSFVASYTFALLLALADLAVERGDDTTESLPLDTRDLAEKSGAEPHRRGERTRSAVTSR